MYNISELEEKLKQLKLQKREFLLAGKETNKLDDEIESIENVLKVSTK